MVSTAKNKFFVGSSIGLLPGESSLSALLRLAWYNELQPNLLYKIISGKATPGYNDDFRNPKFINRQLVLESTGWDLPTPEEKIVISIIVEYADIWFSKRLRICPVCLECGYHSIWFQLTSLSHCPIHACMLQITCQSCGFQLPVYCFDYQLFSHPYICSSCKNPLSGAPLVSFPATEINPISKLLSDVFNDLNSWIRRFTRAGVRNACIVPDRSRWNFANNDLEMVIALAERCNPLPAVCTPKPYRSHVVLAWKIQMPRTVLALGVEFNKTRGDFCSFNRVLRAVVRRFEYWLFGSTHGLAPAWFKALMKQAAICRMDFDCDPAVVAYMAFRERWVMGSACDTSPKRNNTYLRDLSLTNSDMLNSQLPKIAFRNVLYADLAELYWEVCRSRSLGHRMSLFNYQKFHNYVSNINGDGLAEGFVAFRSVRGLPISRIPPWHMDSSTIKTR